MNQSKLPLIIGTGLNGLVGSRVVALLSKYFSWINFDIMDPNRPVDITDINSIRSAMGHYHPQALLHCAAFTNVTAAWEQTNDKNGLCYQVNVIGTKNIAQVCQENQIHLIHLSTAYVFDGAKPTPYLETDKPNPIEWYGQTKLWAEEIIQQINPKFTILRIDQPFRPDNFVKLDTVHRIIEGIKQNNLYPQFTDHNFGPTYIDSLAKIIHGVIENNFAGLYHATNNEAWTDYDFATAIAKLMNYGGEIKKGSLTDYLKTTNRPYQTNTALDSTLIWQTLKLTPDKIANCLTKTVKNSL